MTPESGAYLAKAREDLQEADQIAAIGLAKAAARSAYYAAFHAAQAFIVAQAGKSAKTHSGVRATFAQLAKAAPGIDRTFSTFLAQAYKYKEMGDYGLGEETAVTIGEAKDAIEKAKRFVDGIREILS